MHQYQLTTFSLRHSCFVAEGKAQGNENFLSDFEAFGLGKTTSSIHRFLAIRLAQSKSLINFSFINVGMTLLTTKSSSHDAPHKVKRMINLDRGQLKSNEWLKGAREQNV